MSLPMKHENGNVFLFRVQNEMEKQQISKILLGNMAWKCE